VFQAVAIGLRSSGRHGSSPTIRLHRRGGVRRDGAPRHSGLQLRARPRLRRLPPDLGQRQVAAVATNVLDCSFETPAPNRKWIPDFAYVWTAEGWLYVAAIIDLFSRRVVGWSMCSDDGAARDRRPVDGDLATRPARCAAASLRSRQPNTPVNSSRSDRAGAKLPDDGRPARPPWSEDRSKIAVRCLKSKTSIAISAYDEA